MVMNLCVNARDAMPNGGRLTIRLAVEEKSEPKKSPGEESECDLLPFSPSPLLPFVFRLSCLAHRRGHRQRHSARRSGKDFRSVLHHQGIRQGHRPGRFRPSLGIVKGHDGFINVTSTVGVGTKFSVYLPAVESAAPNTPEESQRPLPRGQGELILVVDDEPTIRQVTRKQLEANGYKVLTASDGGEAVDLYAQHGNKIKVVLTDMMMPGMDGPTATQKLRKVESQHQDHRLQRSGQQSRQRRSRRHPFPRFLPKPFSAADLLRALQEVLNDN